jgi:hypothetical protein
MGTTLTVAILYLTVLTNTEKDFNAQLHPISKYSDYTKCSEHKKHVIKSMKRKGEYSKDMLFFCTLIKYDNTKTNPLPYIEELPFCNKVGNKKYHCGYVY